MKKRKSPMNITDRVRVTKGQYEGRSGYIKSLPLFDNKSAFIIFDTKWRWQFGDFAWVPQDYLKVDE